MDVNQYLNLFIDESREYLQKLNSNLLYLENHPQDMETINEIFRVAHTLKGMSSTMGFTNIANLTHEMENLLSEVRNGNIELNEEMVNVLFKCLDVLERYVNNIEEMGIEGDIKVSGLIDEIRGLLNLSTTEKETEDKTISVNEFKDYELNVIKDALVKGFKPLKIQIYLKEDCLLKAARAFMVFKALEKEGEVFKTVPSIEDIEDEKFKDNFTIFILTKRETGYLQQLLLGISEVIKVIVEEVHLNEGVSNIDVSIDVKTEKIVQDEDEINQNKKEIEKNKTSKTVRVDIERLDKLMNLVSELIIIKTRLEGLDTKANQDMVMAIEYLERITTNLHDAVMKVRMVPIERVYNRFPRMVRDLSKELGKEINLYMSGEETEVDRTVIDEIGDPLVHLIRNAIDHGIETPEERQKMGKPSKGKIYLRAYHDGNNVVIEVEDDGKGIDKEKVKQKALEKKLLTKEEILIKSDKEIIDLLFTPGFSTADKVTDISGRGVGLDVVKKKIENLGGMVEVKTQLGKGTKFIIRLPLTLAIIQALLIKVGQEKYAIPLSSIKEIMKIRVENIKKVKGREMVLYRGNILPIIRLNRILDLDDEISNSSRDLTVVIVKKGDFLAGLTVDSLIGQQEIVIKSLGKYLSNNRIIAGATILGDGNVALILDPNILLSEGEMNYESVHSV